MGYFTERPIELLLSNRLISGIVIYAQVGMFQSFRSRDPLVGIKYEHLCKEVNSCEQILSAYKNRSSTC